MLTNYKEAISCGHLRKIFLKIMKKIVSSLLFLSLLSACGISNARKIGLALYSNVKEDSSDVKINNLNFSVGGKIGTACAKNILSVYSIGDLTVATAKKNGGINNITSVSTEVKNRVLWSTVCTVVNGN